MKKTTVTSDVPLMQQQDALEMYFNALLSEIDEPIPVKSEPQVQHNGLAEEQSKLVIKAAFETPIEVLAKKKSELATDEAPANSTEINDFTDRANTVDVSESLVETPEDSKQPISASVDVIPKWASSFFQVISFSLEGKLCAASINLIAGIIPTPTNLTYLPGQAPWFLGLHQYKGSTVSVIDLALVIGRSKNKLGKRSDLNLPKGYVVLIGDARWGFVIKNMGNMITLENKEVRWRRQREHADIVVGTVVKDMSTLLDLDVLLKNLS